MEQAYALEFEEGGSLTAKTCWAAEIPLAKEAKMIGL